MASDKPPREKARLYPRNRNRERYDFGTIPRGDKITPFDIGVGASCIYLIIGVAEYGWKFIGSDIDPKSIASTRHIVGASPSLKDKIERRLQENPKDVFYGIINRAELWRGHSSIRNVVEVGAALLSEVHHTVIAVVFVRPDGDPHRIVAFLQDILPMSHAFDVLVDE